MRCVKVVFDVKTYQSVLLEKIQSEAHARALEGCLIVHHPNTIKIVVCGTGDAVELFVDFIYAVMAAYEGNQMAVDAFLKDKDYRGVFRVIA